MLEVTTTAGERRVLAETPSGRVVDLSDLGDEQRVVSPDVIRRLCVGSEASSVDPRGVHIRAARIVTQLDLSFSTLPHPLRFEATTFAVAPDLSGAHLPSLWVTGCSLPGLMCAGLRLDRDLRLVSSKVTGEVRLPSAKIGGDLICKGATLTNRGGCALFAEGAEIDGGVFLDEGFSAIGGVRLPGAKIGHYLDCAGATLANEADYALFAGLSEINGSVFLREGFSATGEVRLSGAKIRGDLDCKGATLVKEGGYALFAVSAEINGSVFLREGFSATGEVRLSGAKIGGDLDCKRAILVNQSGVDGIALAARDTTLGRRLIFRHVHVRGGVDLFRASAATLNDDLGLAGDPLGSWRDVDPLVLDGFAYTRFGRRAEWGWKSRCRWLKATPDFQHGAWQHLIDVYRAAGRDEEATRTAIAMQNDRLSRGGLPWYRKAGRGALWLFIGHGYRPWLAGVWAAAIIAAFALVVCHWSGMLVPSKQEVTGAPQPVAYATDVFLPIIDLGQAGDWRPTGWVRWVDWSVILLGWALTTIFVAGFTRIVRSE
jgi:hypothetical protein